jgi:hypothetical protein
MQEVAKRSASETTVVLVEDKSNARLGAVHRLLVSSPRRQWSAATESMRQRKRADQLSFARSKRQRHKNIKMRPCFSV